MTMTTTKDDNEDYDDHKRNLVIKGYRVIKVICRAEDNKFLSWYFVTKNE